MLYHAKSLSCIPMVNHPLRLQMRALGRKMHRARRSHDCYAVFPKPSMQVSTTLFKHYTAAWDRLTSAQARVLKLKQRGTRHHVFMETGRWTRFRCKEPPLDKYHLLKRRDDGSYSNMFRDFCGFFHSFHQTDALHSFLKYISPVAWKFIIVLLHMLHPIHAHHEK